MTNRDQQIPYFYPQPQQNIQQTPPAQISVQDRIAYFSGQGRILAY